MNTDELIDLVTSADWGQASFIAAVANSRMIDLAATNPNVEHVRDQLAKVQIHSYMATNEYRAGLSA